MLRLAVIVSHPIQHFAPWYRELARLGEVEPRVFFGCDWGVARYRDREFGTSFEWDIPLLEGYGYEFLPIARRPRRRGFWELDNPAVGEALERFGPDVAQVVGYRDRTMWRVAQWTRRRGVPLLLFSDSNGRARTAWWKWVAKEAIVRRFYERVDGALCVGDNNRAYHLRYGLPPERLFPGVYPIDRARLLGAVGERNRVREALRGRLGIPEEAFVVLFCGEYSPRKRPLDLIAAAWAAVGQGLPIWSLMVGEGAQRGAMEAFCRREGVTNTVMTGFVNQASIGGYYAAADVLAVTSGYDPHPLVVTEGAAFGLPVIASNRVGCIGATDTARPGINALVYACGDRRGLQGAIARLCRERGLYARMSAAAAEIAATQDAAVAARALAEAAREVQRLGPRKRDGKASTETRRHREG